MKKLYKKSDHWKVRYNNNHAKRITEKLSILEKI